MLRVRVSWGFQVPASLYILFMFCFYMNVFPCLWVYINIILYILYILYFNFDIHAYISSRYNIYSDIIHFFRFCIGFCLIFVHRQVMYGFTNHLFSKLYLKNFAFLCKSFICNIFKLIIEIIVNLLESISVI